MCLWLLPLLAGSHVLKGLYILRADHHAVIRCAIRARGESTLPDKAIEILVGVSQGLLTNSDSFSNDIQDGAFARAIVSIENRDWSEIHMLQTFSCN